ncbi:hypothetical protein FNF27_02229 [Cafeteria roenbergensis]|uniref:GDT1 family protein n=1 Tax=Cafeteria roenbergensis TaxID=33653 RepID=A0A5A8EF64_CAFRO|nr:hypothetical protein FNF27_02229 [Cafeteria roenbergensis]
MRVGPLFVLAAAALVAGASAEWPWHNSPSEVPDERRTPPRGASKSSSPPGVLALPKKAASTSAPAVAHGRDGSAGKAPEPEVTAAFDKLDKNHDGLLNRQEFASIEHTAGVDGIMAGVSKLGSGHTFWGAFAYSMLMIIVTELGDKTFFLAALMAMRHPRSTVFAGTMASVIVMHVLSVGIGFALPSLLPRIYTHYAAIAMFLFFGVQLLWDARTAGSDASEGLEEAEEELSKDNDKKEDAASPDDDDDDDDDNAAADGKEDANSSTPKHLRRRASSASRSRPVPVRGRPTVPMSAFAVLATTFTMTFLGEWGDRSQIATIAMGAAKDPLGVCVGGLIGHALCTGLAVLGGKLLATRISERAVLIVGGVLFLAFAVHSLWAGPDA